MHYAKKLSLHKNHREFDGTIDWFYHVVLALVGLEYEAGPTPDDTQLIDWEDKYLLVESMVLYLVAAWDSFVEDEMVILLSADTKRFCEHFRYSLPDTISKDEAEAILLGRRGYMDFKSMGDITTIAGQCLVGSLNPFRHIPADAKELISQLYTIRNHIAHISKKATLSYERAVLSKHGLSRYKDPGRFLLATPKGATQSRLEDYADALEMAADSMIKNI